MQKKVIVLCSLGMMASAQGAATFFRSLVQQSKPIVVRHYTHMPLKRQLSTSPSTGFWSNPATQKEQHMRTDREFEQLLKHIQTMEARYPFLKETLAQNPSQIPVDKTWLVNATREQQEYRQRFEEQRQRDEAYRRAYRRKLGYVGLGAAAAIAGGIYKKVQE